METAEIRRRWLAFFEKNGHTIVPSASLVPDDPTLLFVNAGMVPFIPYFLGQETAAVRRAPRACRSASAPSTSRRSARPPRHGTFFQMNGNFSFGDYFKEGAITLRLGAAHHARRRDGRLRLRRRPDLGHRLRGRRRGVRPLARHRRPARGADPAPRQARQLLVTWACPAPAGPCSRDLLRPRPRVRPRRRPGRRRGPLPRDLEPRLHAVRASARARQGRLRHLGRAAAKEHRHRHGPRADRVPPAGRRQHVRDRRGLPGARPGGRADRQALRRHPATASEPRRRRAAARRRRPRALRR